MPVTKLIRELLGKSLKNGRVVFHDKATVEKGAKKRGNAKTGKQVT